MPKTADAEPNPEILVKNVMTVKVATARPSEPLSKAVNSMASKNISCIIVVEGKKALGVVTERDLIKKVLAKGKSTANLYVKDAMTSPMMSISPDYDVITAGNIMRKNNIRRLAVTVGDELKGIITETDIMSATIKYVKRLNWRLVDGQITNKEYERILKDVKMLVNL